MPSESTHPMHLEKKSNVISTVHTSDDVILQTCQCSFRDTLPLGQEFSAGLNDSSFSESSFGSRGHHFHSNTLNPKRRSTSFSHDITHFDQEESSSDSSHVPSIESLCLLTRENLVIENQLGQFIVPLPCHMQKMFVVDNFVPSNSPNLSGSSPPGQTLLLWRQDEHDGNVKNPILFELQHPLQEIKPVCQFLSDGDEVIYVGSEFEVCFVDKMLPIIVLYQRFRFDFIIFKMERHKLPSNANGLHGPQSELFLQEIGRINSDDKNTKFCISEDLEPNNNTLMNIFSKNSIKIYHLRNQYGEYEFQLKHELRNIIDMTNVLYEPFRKRLLLTLMKRTGKTQLFLHCGHLPIANYSFNSNPQKFVEPSLNENTIQLNMEDGHCRNLSISSFSIYKTNLIKSIFQILQFVIPSKLFSAMHFDILSLYSTESFHDEYEIMLSFFQYQLGVDPSSYPKANNEAPSYWDQMNQAEENSILNTRYYPLPNNLECKTKSDEISSFLPIMLFSLHLLYENNKLHALSTHDSSKLVRILKLMASYLNWDLYTDYYNREFPSQHQLSFSKSDEIGSNRWIPQHATIKYGHLYPTDQYVPSIHRFLFEYMKGQPKLSNYPFIVNCGALDLSRKICRLYYALYDKNLQADDYMHQMSNSSFTLRQVCNQSPQYRCVHVLHDEKMTLQDLQMIQYGITVPIQESLVHCQKNPSSTWSNDMYELIGRVDLAKMNRDIPKFGYNVLEEREVWSYYDFDDRYIQHTNELQDQSHHLARWQDEHRGIGYQVFRDKRLDQVWAMLSSSAPLCMKGNMELTPQLEAQLAVQILSYPIGRGMLTLSTKIINMTDHLDVPEILLEALIRVQKSSHVRVDLKKRINDLPNKEIWPQFHNGVAEALSIVSSKNDPYEQRITREWIVFHNPPQPQPSNAGTLLALGIQGHLHALDRTDIFYMLRNQHEPTSIAILLGLAASKMGTQDTATTRTLSMHVQPLTNNNEIEIPTNIQTSALLGLGLLYMGSGNKFMSSVIFEELTKPPTDTAMNREAYCLASGFAIGLISLGRGSETGPPADLEELKLDDKLYKFMVGGRRPQYDSYYKPQNKSIIDSSTKVQESPNLINVDVTGPGACVALTLIYLKTENKKIAQKIRIPDTKYCLEYVRPDLILLRTLGYNLILWNRIEPSVEWILGNVPSICLEDIDLEGSSWLNGIKSYCISGACFALALKYAGSGNQKVYNLIDEQINRVESTMSPNDRTTTDHCIIICVVALAMIMSGRGYVPLVNRILKHRVSQRGNYGHQMALCMALGLNFLSGGRCSLNSSSSSVALLLLSFYPRFPSHLNDNQYHLQAFRHLYALVARPRLLHCIDVDTQKPCFVPVKIYTKTETQTLTLPGIVPEPQDIVNIKIDSPVYFQIDLSQKMKESVLKDFILYVKKRTAYLPQKRDTPISNLQSIDAISPFSSQKMFQKFETAHNKHIFTFAKMTHDSNQKVPLMYRSLRYDHPDSVYLYEFLQHSLKVFNKKMSHMWNIKLVLVFYGSSKFSDEVVLSQKNCDEILLQIEDTYSSITMKDVERYKQSNQLNKEFGTFLEYYDIEYHRAEKLKK